MCGQWHLTKDSFNNTQSDAQLPGRISNNLVRLTSIGVAVTVAGAVGCSKRRDCDWSSDGVALPTRCAEVSGDGKFNCAVRLRCPRLDGLSGAERKRLPLHEISSRELAWLVFETAVLAANLVNEKPAAARAQKAPKW